MTGTEARVMPAYPYRSGQPQKLTVPAAVPAPLWKIAMRSNLGSQEGKHPNGS